MAVRALTDNEVIQKSSASTLPDTATLTRRSLVLVRELAVEETSPASLRSTFDPYGKVIKSLMRLAALTTGWDGFGAPVISPSAIATARSLLEGSKRSAMVAPSVSPTVAGGVQLEWFRDAWELHLEVEPSGSYLVFYFNPETHETWEGDLDQAPTGLTTVLQRFLGPA